MTGRLLALVLCASLLNGCGLSWLRSEPVAGQAELLVYRPGSLSAYLKRYVLVMDELAVAELPNGSFVRLRAAPGTHALKVADTLEAEWSKALEADTRYYVRLAVSGQAPKYTVALKQVSPDTARAELEGLRELEPAPAAAGE